MLSAVVGGILNMLMAKNVRHLRIMVAFSQASPTDDLL